MSSPPVPAASAALLAPPDPDQLIIACAASREGGGAEALQGLRLPHLEQLLGRLQMGEAAAVDADSPDMPHERAMARALGLRAGSGHAPWAALALCQRGIDPGDQAWAWITPCHWQIGMDHVLLQDPAALQLQGDEAAALLAAMAPYFAEDGLQLQGDDARADGEPVRWLACGEALRDLPTASLDRVIGRDIGPWLPHSDRVRPLRRLQSEMQMLLYNHPVNDARLAQRRVPVNAFWISGAGALDEPASALPAPPTLELRLKSAALQHDWPRWRAAWQAVDDSACAALLARQRAGHPVRLSLCGDQGWRSWQGTPSGLFHRISHFFGTQPASKGLSLL